MPALVVRRTHDRSDGEIFYEVCAADELPDDDEWDPWNGAPEIDEDAWVRVRG